MERHILGWIIRGVIIIGIILSIGLSGKMAAFSREEITLTVWINDFPPSTHKWIKSVLIPEFEKEHPNIKIDYLYVGWAHHSEKYLTAWASGETPDIFEPALEQAEEMVAKGEVLPLNRYIAEWKDLDDFFPVAVNQYKVKGKYYCVPFRLDLRSIHYRKDIFREVGLDPEKAPDTWEDLKVAVAKTTVRKGRRLIRAGYSLTTDANFLGQQFVELLWQNGTDALSKDRKKAGFNNPRGVEALQFLVDIYNTVAPPGVGYLPEKYPVPLFAIGKIAIEYSTGADGYYKLRKYAPEHLKDLGICLPLKKRERWTNNFAGGFSITSRCKHPDEAWEFIKFFTNTKNQVHICKDSSVIPARKSALNDPYYQSPVFKRIFEGAKYGRVYLMVPEWWMLMSKLGDDLLAAVRKAKTPEEALSHAEAEWNKVLGKE